MPVYAESMSLMASWDQAMNTVDYLPLLGTMSAIAIGMAVSPGQDFALVSRNAILYSRRAGVLASLGISAAVWFHVSYCVAGVAILITQFPSLYLVLRMLGAGYLIYLGISSLWASSARPEQSRENLKLGDFAAFRSGFWCNVLNPKTTLFFLSIFTQIITPQTPLMVQLLCGAIISLAHFAWFAILAFWLSTPRLLDRIWTLKPWIERIMGVLLCALALHVLLG